jgi:outer membrane cobalamin receptor
MKKVCTLMLSLLIYLAQAEENATLSGHIKDAVTAETLIGANVYAPALQIGAITDFNGFYTINLPAGKHQLQISFIGYETKTIQVTVSGNRNLDLKLTPSSTQLAEVTVTDRVQAANVEDMKMSSEVLSIKTIKEIPAFMGEVDVLKAIQALPGVQSGGEGTTGYFVRGGSADQNLVLLDGATVYSPSHLMGFFSVFNADVIKEAELYKGGVPAQYGGRSASLLDIKQRNGDNEKFHGNGGLGLIASRLSLEGPIQKGKSSFLVAGRRTYADVFTRMSNKPDLKNSIMYFYDLSGRLNFRLGEKDVLTLSGYYGDDVLNNKEQLSWNWGNRTASVNWKHSFSQKLFADISALHSDYNYTLAVNSSENSDLEWKARIKDETLRADFTYLANSKYTFKFGAASIYHTIHPGNIRITNQATETSLELETQRALESSAYLSSSIKVNDEFTIDAGLRYSLFQNIGGTVNHYQNGTNEPVSSTDYDAGQFHGTQGGFEPRLSMRYLVGPSSSIKMSYNRMMQYLQLASNSTTGTPLDIYFPASENIKPQIADQIALGYFKNFNNNSYEFSAEVYYKYMQNQIDFKDNANLILNEHLENEVLSGEGKAYGLELMLKKTQGKLTGWISYTLSHTERTIEGINKGNAYSPIQDRPHAINIVSSYQIKPRLQFGAAWTYSSGAPISLPTSSYEFDGVVVPVYDEKNGYRLPDSHRLDISFTLDGKKKPGRKWDYSYNLSIYNLYARQNPFSIQVRQNADNPKQTEAVQTSLVGTIVPAFTLNIKF